MNRTAAFPIIAIAAFSSQLSFAEGSTSYECVAKPGEFSGQTYDITSEAVAASGYLEVHSPGPDERWGPMGSISLVGPEHSDLVSLKLTPIWGQATSAQEVVIVNFLDTESVPEGVQIGKLNQPKNPIKFKMSYKSGEKVHFEYGGIKYSAYAPKFKVSKLMFGCSTASARFSGLVISGAQ